MLGSFSDAQIILRCLLPISFGVGGLNRSRQWQRCLPTSPCLTSVSDAAASLAPNPWSQSISPPHIQQRLNNSFCQWAFEHVGGGGGVVESLFILMRRHYLTRIPKPSIDFWPRFDFLHWQLTQVRKARPGSVEFREQVQVNFSFWWFWSWWSMGTKGRSVVRCLVGIDQSWHYCCCIELSQLLLISSRDIFDLYVAFEVASCFNGFSISWERFLELFTLYVVGSWKRLSFPEAWFQRLNPRVWWRSTTSGQQEVAEICGGSAAVICG